MSDTSLANELGKAGRVRAVADFGWDKVATTTINLYRSDGLAVISSTGIVTFDDGPPATLKSALDQIAAAVNASGAATAAGEAALFTFGGKTYLFVSDAANGLTLGDAIVELVGVSTTLTSGITLSATGDIIGVG